MCTCKFAFRLTAVGLGVDAVATDASDHPRQSVRVSQW